MVPGARLCRRDADAARGYGETSGPWLEEYGRCSDPDFYRGGLPAAEDMESAVRYLEKLPYVQPGAHRQSSGNPPAAGAVLPIAAAIRRASSPS
jgi:hypothetical protein